MALQLLSSATLNPATGTLTPRFVEATGFYLNAPTITSEIEIDVFLQVYIITQAGEAPRNYPLGKLKDGAIKLNETDTETINSIPNEFLESGLEMAFLFLPSEAIPLEVWLVVPDCNLCAIDTRISAIATQLDNFSTAVSDRFLEIENQLTQILNAIDAIPAGNSNNPNNNGTNNGNGNGNATTEPPSDNTQPPTINVVDPVSLPADTTNFFLFL